MAEVLTELNNYPVKTRLSLTGTLVVARDIAHAKIKERLDAGQGMPDYLKKYPVYYAGPAKTPQVSCCRAMLDQPKLPRLAAVAPCWTSQNSPGKLLSRHAGPVETPQVSCYLAMLDQPNFPGKLLSRPWSFPLSSCSGRVSSQCFSGPLY